MNSQKGQALISILIGSAVVTTMMAGFILYLTAQQREAQSIREHLAAKDFEMLIGPALGTSSVCKYALNTPNPLAFNAARLPQTITLPDTTPIHASVSSDPTPVLGEVVATVGAPASPIAGSLKIKTIQLNITSGSSGRYSGSWTINYDPAETAGPIKPTTIPVNLVADDSTPGSAKITGCSGIGQALAAPPCAYATTQGGTNTLVGGSGYTPSSFSEAFVSSNVGWGLGCKAGWRLTSCAINTGGDADINFYSTDTSLPVCFSDNEEWGGTISAICCKVQ